MPKVFLAIILAAILYQPFGVQHISAAESTDYTEQEDLFEDLSEENSSEENSSEPDSTEKLVSSSDPELDQISGHWVDVNGDTTLDFVGDFMTISYGSYWQDTYQIRIVGEGDYREIVNADGTYGYEMMSQITYRPKERVMLASEMLLDADGHSYRFVKEEDLARELAVRDRSKNLPTTIESREIEEFSLAFTLEATRYDVTDISLWLGGSYSLYIEKMSDDEYEMSFSAMGDSYIIHRWNGTVDGEFMAGLADLLDEIGAAKKNGLNVANNEDYPGWYLYVEYASGEEIDEYADGRPALECPFSINAILEYANQEMQLTDW